MVVLRGAQGRVRHSYSFRRSGHPKGDEFLAIFTTTQEYPGLPFLLGTKTLARGRETVSPCSPVPLHTGSQTHESQPPNLHLRIYNWCSPWAGCRPSACSCVSANGRRTL